MTRSKKLPLTFWHPNAKNNGQKISIAYLVLDKKGQSQAVKKLCSIHLLCSQFMGGCSLYVWRSNSVEGTLIREPLDREASCLLSLRRLRPMKLFSTSDWTQVAHIGTQTSAGQPARNLIVVSTKLFSMTTDFNWINAKHLHMVMILQVYLEGDEVLCFIELANWFQLRIDQRKKIEA